MNNHIANRTDGHVANHADSVSAMKVLLCGSGYASSYVPCLTGGTSPLSLSAILARGSDRSRRLARTCGVPHVTALTDAPRCDLVIVAVPGKAGVSLVVEALERGLHVLAEHPVEPAELEHMLEVAARMDRVLHVNAHWGDIERVASVVEACRQADRYAAPQHVSILANPRTLYSCMDIVGCCLDGLNPFDIRPVVSDQQNPFAVLVGTVRGVSITVQCQRFTSALGDNSAALVGHHVLVVYPHGQVSLAEAHGPAAWCYGTKVALNMASVAKRPACWTALSGSTPTPIDTFVHQQRRAANMLALKRLSLAAQYGRTYDRQTPEYLLGLARAWRTLIDAVGPIAILER